MNKLLKKYTIYYNWSFQYGDYDMSSYYKNKIEEIKSKILDGFIDGLSEENGITKY